MSRLETVTNRLEALATRIDGGGGAPSPAAAAPAAAGGASDKPFVKAFDDMVSSFFTPVETGAKAIGADLEGIVAAFKEAIKQNRALLSVASRCKKPADQVYSGF